MNTSMSRAKLALLTTLTLLAFAANSLLCRLALRESHIDAASFTALRLASGALMLCAILPLRGGSLRGHGSWLSAFALFAYAGGFSYAYLSLPASTGALLLFGAVQATMIGYALWRGESLNRVQCGGLALACGGLIVLMLPGLSAPSPAGAALMLGAGVAWGIYSLRGRGGKQPAASTAGNFIRSLPFAALLSVAMASSAQFDSQGVAYACVSGALASGLGYLLWYSALPGLRATSAAIVQLSVPVLAALGGVVVLDEVMTAQFLCAAAATLGGVALAIAGNRQRH
jgi:drug/metabolite transporter (DMT)-like permease